MKIQWTCFVREEVEVLQRETLLIPGNDRVMMDLGAFAGVEPSFLFLFLFSLRNGVYRLLPGRLYNFSLLQDMAQIRAIQIDHPKRTFCLRRIKIFLQSRSWKEQPAHYLADCIILQIRIRKQFLNLLNQLLFVQCATRIWRTKSPRIRHLIPFQIQFRCRHP
jgi:hypothetical protein